MSGAPADPTSARPWSALVGTLRRYAVFTLDADGVIDSWNEGVRVLLGYEEHEFLGRRGAVIFTPEDRAQNAVERELAKARETGEAGDDRWHLRRDGSRIWVNGVMHAVRDATGTVVGFVKIMRDQTEWRATHEQLEQQRRFVTAILDSLPGVFYMVDGRRLVHWNHELERVTGLGDAALAAAGVDEVVVEAEAAREHIEAAFRTGRASMEGHVRTGDGPAVPYLFTGRRVELDGEPFVLGVGIENREQQRGRRSLERRAREQGAIAELAASALATDDLLPTLDLAARHVSDTLGAEHVEIAEVEEGRVVVRVSRHLGDVAVTPAIEEGRRFEEGPGSFLDESAGPWPDDVLAPLGLKSGIRARIRGREQHTFGFIEALSEREDAFGEDDVRFLRAVAFLLAGAIEQHRLHNELAHRADHDDLTGLLTRVAFERRLVDALERAKRQGSKVAVLFLDLDRFKNVNDSLGHGAGDEVLRHVAKRLGDAVRSWDVVARHGGDEFVLYLPDIATNAEAAHVTERLLEAFSRPFTVAGRELTIGTTIGVATFPDDGADAVLLLRAADTALYEGKTRGRNTFHFFTREQNVRVTERLELEADLRRALHEDELEVLYQPQVDVADGRVRTVEALLRWRHPGKGDLPPRTFLAIAEEIGLAVPLGEWALRRAFADHAGWREVRGAPERIAVNVSAAHFVQPSFPDALAGLAHEAGVEPREIELELSEATMARDPTPVEEHLRALHELGVRIVLDDFGASASPLARLRHLPIDRLKIDGTFTHQVEEPGGRRLLDAIVQLASELGMDAVAEGIETNRQHEVVRQVGFRAAQGRLYAAPLDRVALLAFLRTRAR